MKPIFTELLQRLSTRGLTKNHDLLKRIVAVVILLITAFLFLTCNTTEPQKPKEHEEPTDFSFSIQNWTIYNTSNSAIPDNELGYIAVDNQNHIWIGTFYNGVARFDGSSWTVYNTKNSGLPNDTVQAIAADRDNNIWIATCSGLARFDGTNWKVFDPSNTPMEYRIVFTLAVDKNNVLWVSCGHATAGGLLSYDGKTWKSYTRKNSQLPSSIVYKIHVDKDNNKWIGTWMFQSKGGLVKIDGQNNWQVFTKENSELLYNSVDALASDQNGSVWIGHKALFYLEYGYYHGGLQMLSKDKWEDYSPNPDGKYNKLAVASNRVQELLCDKDGYLWVATEAEWKFNYNLCLFKYGKWKPITDAFSDYPHPFIREMAIDRNNRLWLATQFGAISFNYQIQTK